MTASFDAFALRLSKGELFVDALVVVR